MSARLKNLILKGLVFYSRFISPQLPAHCRFHPSCSNYMHQAICIHGLSHGTYLGIQRILKCHPWHSGGIDPVPPKSGDPFSHPSGRV